MSDSTRDFWLGAACFVFLLSFLGFSVVGFVGLNSYLTWEHQHVHSHPAHEHPHEHESHTHPHPVAEHEHGSHEHEVNLR